MTIAEAKQNYRIATEGEGHFFDPETMQFWNSRVETQVYKNLCFVTSEDNFDRTKKLYTVRQFSPDFKRINTVGDFQAYSSLAAAKEVAKGVEA